MFDRKAPGTYKLEVCRNLSCRPHGSRDVVSYLEKKLGIRVGRRLPTGSSPCSRRSVWAPAVTRRCWPWAQLLRVPDRETVDAIVDALARNEAPPVAPAGYDEKDGEKPLAGGPGQPVPTASQSIGRRSSWAGPGTARGRRRERPHRGAEQGGGS